MQTSLSRMGMESSSGVNDITLMECIGFSKLSPDVNPSVAKEDMVNMVCLHCTCMQVSILLDSVIE